MVIAVDFDDVLCDSKNVKPGFRMGEPVIGAVAGIQRLHQAGHEIIIHTVRGDRPEHVAKWLTYFGIPYDSIAPKVQADLYLDDKAVKFESWESLHDLP